jgi:hypothetical protein
MNGNLGKTCEKSFENRRNIFPATKTNHRQRQRKQVGKQRNLEEKIRLTQGENYAFDKAWKIVESLTLKELNVAGNSGDKLTVRLEGGQHARNRRRAVRVNASRIIDPRSKKKFRSFVQSGGYANISNFLCDKSLILKARSLSAEIVTRQPQDLRVVEPIKEFIFPNTSTGRTILLVPNIYFKNKILETLTPHNLSTKIKILIEEPKSIQNNQKNYRTNSLKNKTVIKRKNPYIWKNHTVKKK